MWGQKKIPDHFGESLLSESIDVRVELSEVTAAVDLHDVRSVQRCHHLEWVEGQEDDAAVRVDDLSKDTVNISSSRKLVNKLRL